jgi:serine/threonine protein kinase
MMLAAGAKLGPYEITGAIGAGGMGEVYRARDTRLDRIVAIKVLPAHLADRADLRERFEREARTIASLNHPHICTLHDVGHQDGIDFLVMEYVEGETLAMRLEKGALPLDQVLQFAIEIADALDKAHRKGITHRDLKPGNIMLTKSGTKLLDFGLAKLQQESAPATPFSQLPTIAEPATAQGMLLGTVQYMAPEQVEGKTDQIDARTDIFAFGAVVYEMATGKKAFEGKSQASLIAKILETDPPPMTSLSPMTPPALDRVVERCLAKDREDRWQSARDVCQELKWISTRDSHSALPSIAPLKAVRALGWRTLLVRIGALLSVAAIASIITWNLKPSPLRPVTRTVINLPAGQQLAGLQNGPALALSPDGTLLSYVARQGVAQQIYLRAMDSPEARAVPGTEGAVNPFFSPDSQWLGFFAGGKVKKISVSGGASLILGDAPFPYGASWGSQGTIAFTPTAGATPLQQVSDAGGTPQSLTHLAKGEVVQRWPDFLPSGEAVLFAAAPNAISFSSSQVAVQSIGTGEHRSLINGGTNPRYVASGHLVYAQGGSLRIECRGHQTSPLCGIPYCSTPISRFTPTM